MTNDFARLGVPAQLVDVLAKRGINVPTPIQEATLPDSFAGRDVMGRGRTGSGKTYAFLLPLVARLAATPGRSRPRQPRALVLAPTRELAAQIHEALQPLGATARLTSQTIFGGVGYQPQVRALERGVDVLIATPGRLIDLMQKGHARLDAVEITVIDEADQMSDMGFLKVVQQIMEATPAKSQRMLFSATLDAAVGVIVKRFLHQPVVHEADSASGPVVEMEHHLLRVSHAERFEVVAELAAAPGRMILFTRTKHGAKKLAKQLLARGVPAVELHGNLNQNARTRNLAAFGSGSVQTLVATDIAARGIHVDDVARVVHADPPVEHKAYLHRSGRTARAGQAGTVITLATPDQALAVRAMMRAARIKPAETSASPGDATLQQLAPGARKILPVAEATALVGAPEPEVGGSRQAHRGGGSGRARRGNAPAGRTDRPAAKKNPGGSQRQHGRPATGTVGGSRTGAAAFSATSGGRGRRR